jgi:hypothetical protein
VICSKKENDSPLDADSLFWDEDSVADAEAIGLGEESLDRLMVRLISKWEGAVMHGDEGLSPEICERTHGLFWIHVDVAPAR